MLLPRGNVGCSLIPFLKGGFSAPYAKGDEKGSIKTPFLRTALIVAAPLQPSLPPPIALRHCSCL